MMDYPRYIQDKPKGVDKFDGGSQKSLSEAIANHILANDKADNENVMPRIIGIEGTWGSGKSNVVKLVENRLSEDAPKAYYFFEYDAWGNQEDLQRRSLLEQLTAELVEKKILIGQTELSVKGDVSKKVTWEEKLKYLLARKTESATESWPRLSNGIIAATLCTILTPITSLIGFNAYACIKWWSIIIALLPIIVTLIVWAIAAITCKRYRNLSYLLAIFNDKINNEVSYETISEDEPSVCEFKSWMRTVSSSLNLEKCRKLVIVFDNMDRLPAEKVKQLWSSIHTFFAESGFDNIWVIIPFDKKHLSCAFGKEGGDEELELTQYFIDKTFPVTFDVAKPVITDYKKIFTTFFKEAFGDTGSDEEETINRIYRLQNKEANVREIIIYINRLVSLYVSRRNDVRLTSMALYQLFKEQLLDNPVEKILSGDYLGICAKIIPNDDMLKAEISALVYGVDLSTAKQIPLQQYLDNCIDKKDGYDINKYADTDTNFTTILREVCRQTDDAKLDFTISALDKLKKSDTSIASIWEEMACRLESMDVATIELSDNYKTLMPHVSSTSRQRLVNKLCDSWRGVSEFDSVKYIKCIDELVSNVGGSCTIPLEQKNVSAEQFVNAVRVAHNQWEKYNLKASPADVESHLLGLLPKEYKHSDVVKILKETKFSDFQSLKTNIHDTLQEWTEVTENNIGELFATLRCLQSIEECVDINFDSSKLSTIKTSLENSSKTNVEDGYLDVLAIQLASGTDINIDETQIAEVASLMDYYANFDDLILNGIGWNHKGLSYVVKYMIVNKTSKKVDANRLLPKYSEIKTRFTVKDEEVLNYFDCLDITIKDEELNGFESKVQISFFEASKSIQNGFTRKVNALAVNALDSNVTADMLKANIKQRTSYYWHQLIDYLLEDECMKVLPQCVVDFARMTIEDIRNSSKNIPLDSYTKKILSKVDYSTITDIFLILRDYYCNNQVSINAEQFLIFEKELRRYGELENRAKEVLNSIIKPVIANPDCKELLLKEAQFYKRLFISAKDAEPFISALQNANWSEDEIISITGKKPMKKKSKD